MKTALIGTKSFNKFGNLVDIIAVQSIFVRKSWSANMCSIQLYEFFVFKGCLRATQLPRAAVNSKNV